MSYENGTLHYNLPQTVGTDKRDWFDTNEAFANIDADLHTAKETAEGNAEALTLLTTRVGNLETHDVETDTALTNLTSRVSACEQAITTLTTELADCRQDFKDSICAYDEGTATLSTRAYLSGDFFWYNDTLYKATSVINIGDTIVPNTNCVTTTITAELLS
mgnify:CR=1 FL=1